jgi:two-component system OmpR family sensor kinase/two-component system sensor histidine kinase BaeS
MRLRLFLAFTLVIVTTLGILTYASRYQFVDVFNTFAQRGGFIGADRLATELEEHYAEFGHWESVEIVFNQSMPGGSSGFGNYQGGMGRAQRGMRGFFLSDKNGMLIYNPEGIDQTETLSVNEVESGIPLHFEGNIIGYLIPPNSMYIPKNILHTNFTPLLNETLLPTLLISGALALALATLVGYYLLRPVRHLTDAVNNMAQGDFSQRVQVGGKDELAVLATRFNQMAASLEHAEESRRSMTTDIAHELRTPLAVQRANLEALQDGIYPLTMENLDPILEQNQLLTRLVEDLRTLAKTDYDDLSLEKHTHDLIPLIEQILGNFQPQATQQQIQLEFTHPDTCQLVDIDARRINQVLNNIIQNAFQHTPEGGGITLSLGCGESHVEITIRDTGAGIPAEALPHIFERFYRGDHSRTHDKGGSGIGLTIARRLIEAHGGTLTAGNHPDGGAVFRISLPTSIS